MIAHELISETIKPLSPEMDGKQALQMMQKYGVQHLPVIGEEEFYGLLSEEEILKNNIETQLEAYLGVLYGIHANRNEHLFEVMKKLAESDLTAIPVLEDDKTYLGTISRTELFEYYHRSFAWSEPGSVIVLELSDAQYSLAEISHIIEAEQAIVLSSIISRPSESNILLTMKVNKLDVSRIVAALRRYDYDVAASFSEDEVSDNFKERYDAFMRYLDV